MLHELWNDGSEETFCLAGPLGDDARRLLEHGSRLVWTVEADSHFDAMTKYYSFKGWGSYTTDFPKIDREPYSERGWE